MKKQILNIGKVLNISEQKQVFGGAGLRITPECSNPSGNTCDPFAGQFHGNPACLIGEVCATDGFCVCPD